MSVAPELFPRLTARWPEICRPDVVVVDVTAATEAFWLSEQVYWGVEDLPNIAPPFQAFFLESGTPQQFYGDRPDGSTGLIDWKTEICHGRFGLLVESCEGERKDAVERWFIENNCVGTFDPEARWLLMASLFLDKHDMLISAIWVKPDGSANCVMHIPSRTGLSAMGFDGMNSAAPHLFLYTISLLLGVAFMHCKNVVVHEGKYTRPERRRAEREQRQLPKFYTLDIDPMKRVLRTEGRQDTEGLRRALHICRGHFATYTTEKPLFGKHVGTYWVPQHVRGSAEFGAIQKEYRVNV